MGNVAKLKNLNELKVGIQKQWIWGSKDKFSLSCDYLQKVNYSIQDLNAEIHNLQEPTRKEIIYVIVLVGWICEAVDSIYKILRKEIIDYLDMKDDEKLRQAKKYFKAIRSFVVAHPLSTSRHEAYGMDGDLICVDVRNRTTKLTEIFEDPSSWLFLTIDGLHENAKDVTSDFILYVYSEKLDQMKYFKYIRVNFSDLYYVVQLQIDRIYALDLKLRKLTKKKVGIQ